MLNQLSRGVAVVVAVSLAALSGCIFSPERKPPTKAKPVEYLAPITPQNVLQNLIKSYTERDSVETAAVYDVSYAGISTDPSAPQPISNFTRQDEIRHVGALKLNNNIVSVYLDLGAPTTWRRQPGNASDPPGSAIIPIPASTIRIDDVGRATLWESVNRVIEYTFVPSVSAPGDTTWTVIGWTETAN
jgi:hypothetical protein